MASTRPTSRSTRRPYGATPEETRAALADHLDTLEPLLRSAEESAPDEMGIPAEPPAGVVAITLTNDGTTFAEPGR
jgi:hypothetical protein